MLNSSDRINCYAEYNEMVAYIVASKGICAGEEIFMSYGLLYWMPHTNVKTINLYMDKYFNEITHNQKRYIINLYNKMIKK